MIPCGLESYPGPIFMYLQFLNIVLAPRAREPEPQMPSMACHGKSAAGPKSRLSSLFFPILLWSVTILLLLPDLLMNLTLQVLLDCFLSCIKGISCRGTHPLTWIVMCFHLSKHKGPGRLCCCPASPPASWGQSRNHHQTPRGFRWTFLSVSVHLLFRYWLAVPHLSCRLLWLPQSSLFEKHHESKWLCSRASESLPGRPAALEEKKKATCFSAPRKVTRADVPRNMWVKLFLGRNSDGLSVDCYHSRFLEKISTPLQHKLTMTLNFDACIV